jgi:hypothetical protein
MNCPCTKQQHFSQCLVIQHIQIVFKLTSASGAFAVDRSLTSCLVSVLMISTTGTFTSMYY